MVCDEDVLRRQCGELTTAAHGEHAVRILYKRPNILSASRPSTRTPWHTRHAVRFPPSLQAEDAHGADAHGAPTSLTSS
eukprot:5005894-Prymnesium_polylepis.1